MDRDFCDEQAKLVRSLAEKADPIIKQRLQQLTEHYERRLAILNKEEVREPEQKRAAFPQRAR